MENIHLGDKKIAYCTACNACDKSGRCVIEDDAPDILRKIWTADAVIISTPIYFMGPPAHLKALIDRGQSYWVTTFRLTPSENRSPKRPAGLIMVGGMNFNYMFDPTLIIVKSFYASMGLKLSQTIHDKKVDSPAAIREHASALRDSYKLGQTLVGAE